MRKILITGGSGFVGSNLATLFSSSSNSEVFSTYMNHPIDVDDPLSIHPIQLDVRNEKEVISVFHKIKPTVVIHAAGNKNVRDCEKNPDDAYKTNALGTQNVARVCHDIDAHLIYVSTDLVFSCTDGQYQETDIPEPSLVYGKTKLKGEEIAKQEHDRVAICRSGGIYGNHSPLLQWLSKQLLAGQAVECFTDVMNTPTYVVNLGEMFEVIINNNLTGIFHTVGSQRVSRFDLFTAYAKEFNLDTHLLVPTTVGQHGENLFLQKDASLRAEKTSAILGMKADAIAEGFRRLAVAGGV
ncbi:MAG: SDR family oxidoreductase [Roseofilum sp. SBFL]|uniref:SDR family oxidoreductase n=1 Tax=unclassified Roseofilum TaxID=2620099 RepID=UPI001B13C411|nr:MULTISPECIES: SDR family oxidoreductase [unclassified Roseofilum]MBP0014398.1 SDR family oxidoreductase [Roseofilum sp. SID3]MBP0025963.1 SDR family oxidoreductase [Roseofilum sp. SID2]MBP0036135.1 SDR family oxidoreductase [Roseofilum sp. SID1]MBP0040503.1 SDR family oxidoreductase [Roseofilum sp. SBFL]